MNSPQTISVQNPPTLAFTLPLVASFLAPIRQLSVSLTSQAGSSLVLGQGAQANNEVKAAWAANNAMLEVLTFGLFDFVTTAAAYAICLTSGEFSERASRCGSPPAWQPA